MIPTGLGRHMDIHNEFQAVGPDTEKPRSPYHVIWQREMMLRL